jgi:hypothetical protein
MPDQPSWIESIPQILEQLESPDAPPFLDRPAVERLFGLRRRQAIALLRQFGGFLAGKAFLAPREAVVAFLRATRREAALADDRARFERLSVALGQARRDSGQRRIVIPAPAASTMEISGLPDGVRLESSQLTIQFQRPDELLQKLFALAQALAHDYQTFEQSWLAATGDRP